MKKPRILFFDIETRYIIFRGWRTGKQYVDQKQIVLGQDSDIICLSYKWLGEREIHSLDWGLHKQDSGKMVKEFGNVVEKADIVIGHNSDKFDARHINTQRLLHNLPPIDWPTSQDTLKAIRKHFYLPSYRLDYFSKLLHGEGKSPMEFQDWIEIVENKSQKHLDKMIKYNKRDVMLLERDYKRIADHLTPKIHVGILNGKTKSSCPQCGSEEVQSQGIRATSAGRYQRLRCIGCGRSYKGAKV